MFFAIRVVIGLVFITSGAEKALGAYQNFLYAIQAYQVLPGWAEELTARIFPWVELLTGVFLVLGLWTAIALRSALVMFAVFITIVGQALLRKLPLDQCGCFGELIHLAPQTVIVIDSVFVLLVFLLLRNPSKTLKFSLDRIFTQ